MGRGPTVEGRKNAEDAKRAKVFTKLIREITVATRSGVGDPAGNPRLRAAVDKALAANMTRETIDRAVKRGSGADGGADMQELRYEGYGPAGIALIIDCVSDNPLRTVADVRHALTRHGGNLGTSGSVAFQFTETGEIIFDIRSDAALEEKILEAALDAGADDVQTADGYTDVLTQPAELSKVRVALEATGLTPIEADVVMRPANRVAVDAETAQAIQHLIERLEELDDVQSVHHNADLSEVSEA